jgi:hypothetical protein
MFNIDDLRIVTPPTKGNPHISEVEKEEFFSTFGEIARSSYYTSYSASLALHRIYPKIEAAFFESIVQNYRRDNFCHLEDRLYELVNDLGKYENYQGRHDLFEK